MAVLAAAPTWVYRRPDDGTARGQSPSKASIRRAAQKPSRSGRMYPIGVPHPVSAGPRRTATRKSYQSDRLDTQSLAWSHRGMAATELHRRAAVDLGRVASALCPMR